MAVGAGVAVGGTSVAVGGRGVIVGDTVVDVGTGVGVDGTVFGAGWNVLHAARTNPAKINLTNWDISLLFFIAFSSIVLRSIDRSRII